MAWKHTNTHLATPQLQKQAGRKTSPCFSRERRKRGKLGHMTAHLLDGALQLVHVAFKQREVGEEEVLEAAVLLGLRRQREDHSDGDLLLAGHAKAGTAALVRHVEALLH